MPGRGFVGILGLLASLTLASPLDAQPSDEDVGNAEYFVLFPELRTSPAPDVLQPGLRVSYQAISGGGGTGGGGILQYDVVALGPTAVSSQANYGDVGAGLVPLGQTVALGVPGVGPFWIHPSVLVGAESVASDNLSVSRVTKQIAGATREVVRFQTNTADGSRVVDEFSAASGLMVFSSIGTNETGSQVTLLSARTIETPWPADTAPNWARPGTFLEFTGARSTTIPGAGTTEQAASATVRALSATSRWTTFQQTRTVGGLDAGTGIIATGVGQLHGGIWLPRGALDANLPSEPTLLDQDPDTGAQTFVVSDSESVKIQQELPAAILSWTYSRPLGVLEEQRVVQQGVSATEETVFFRSGGSDLPALAEAGPLPDDDPGRDEPTEDDSGTPEQDDASPAENGGDEIEVLEDEDSGGCVTAAGQSPSGELWLVLVALSTLKTRRRSGVVLRGTASRMGSIASMGGAVLAVLFGIRRDENDK